MYNFKSFGSKREMLKSPVMKTLSIRQLLAMNYASSNSNLTKVRDKIYMDTVTPYFPSGAYKYYVSGILQPVEGNPTPVMMNFAVTANCICDCRHCSFSDRTKKNQLSVADLRDAITQVQDLGTNMIGFTGGEPLLRNDIEEIISLVGSKSISLLFFTGFGLTPERVRGLKAAGLGIPVVSLDHYKLEIHDKRRSKEGIHVVGLHTTVRLLSIEQSKEIIWIYLSLYFGKIPAFYKKMGG